jgi:hypothetical protein
MLFIHIHLGRPSGLFPSGFPTNNLYTFLFSPIRATCPAYLTILGPGVYSASNRNDYQEQKSYVSGE